MSISLIRLVSIQVNPNSDQHLISPNNITNKIRNIWRMMTRTYMLISGL